MRPTGQAAHRPLRRRLQNWVRLQNDYDCFFFVADWHALTTDYADTSRVKETFLRWPSTGSPPDSIPEKATLFIQSHVPQHAELHLLLSMMTPLGWLERVPTYKEQKENLKEKDLNTYGFLGYPVLHGLRHSDVSGDRMFPSARIRFRTWRSRVKLRAGSTSSTARS